MTRIYTWGCREAGRHPWRCFAAKFVLLSVLVAVVQTCWLGLPSTVGNLARNCWVPLAWLCWP